MNIDRSLSLFACTFSWRYLYRIDGLFHHHHLLIGVFLVQGDRRFTLQVVLSDPSIFGVLTGTRGPRGATLVGVAARGKSCDRLILSFLLIAGEDPAAFHVATYRLHHLSRLAILTLRHISRADYSGNLFFFHILPQLLVAHWFSKQAAFLFVVVLTYWDLRHQVLPWKLSLVDHFP